VRASRTNIAILLCMIVLSSRNPRSCAAETVAADVTVTPRGWNAEDAFRQLRNKGLRVELLGQRWDILPSIVVPSELRFKPVSGRELVEAVAKFNKLKVSWLNDGATAVIFRGADEAEVIRFLVDIKSEVPAVRADAARRAWRIEDVRVVLPLTALAMEKDEEVSRLACHSLDQLYWPAVLAIAPDAAIAPLEKALSDIVMRYRAAEALGSVGGEKALPLIEKALADQDAYVRTGAAIALGSVGGEKALPLLEKALADQNISVCVSAAIALERVGGEKALPLIEKMLASQDANARCGAVTALRCVGGEEKARDILLKRLAEEKDQKVLEAILALLRERYGGDPEEQKALKARLQQPEPPPAPAP